MSNNKHNSNKPNPNDVIAAARAKQEEPKQPINADAKSVSEDLAKGEAAKATDSKDTGTDDKSTATDDKSTATDSVKTISSRKRKTKDDWKAILEDKEKNNLTAADITAKYDVSEGSVYAWASRFKTDAEKAEVAKLTPLTAADSIKKLLEGVDAKLAAYDADIAKAKEMVANEAAGRKKIEDSKKAYQDIIDTLNDQAV